MRRSESFLNSKIKELKKMFLSMKPKRGNHKSFVLQKVQPALLRLMDSAVSTLAPIFAVAGLTGKPEDAFFVGLAASLGADVSMGPAEALSDDGTVTDRGSTIIRGGITGIATAIGGMLHTFPFLISNISVASPTLSARSLKTCKRR